MRDDRRPRHLAGGPGAGTQFRSEGLGSLAEVLDRILCMGITVDGTITIGVADVELVLLDLRLLLAAVDTVRPEGPFFSAPQADEGPEGPHRHNRFGPSAIGKGENDDARSGYADGTPEAAPRPPTPPRPPPKSAEDRAAGHDRPAGAGAPNLSLLQDGVRPGGGPDDGSGQLRNGLVRLVLTLVNLLHEVLERQALRRMDNGSLTPREIEALGLALQAQAAEIARLRVQFGLSPDDLTLRLTATG